MSDPSLAFELGQLPGAEMDSPYAVRFDKRDDFRPEDLANLGWIGEDSSGIFLRQHPMVAIAERPHLWDAVIEWQSGLHDVTPQDFASKSNFEFECKLTMAIAHAREDARRMKATKSDE